MSASENKTGSIRSETSETGGDFEDCSSDAASGIGGGEEVGFGRAKLKAQIEGRSRAMSDRERFVRNQTEQLLQQAATMTEIALELKDRTALAEKYVCYLRSLSVRTGRVVSAMQQTGKSLLIGAHKLTNSIKLMDTAPEPCFTVKLECEKLISILEKEIAELDDFENVEAILATECKRDSLATIAQKIRYFEEKQKGPDSPGPPRTGSGRSLKADFDEKYPENLCRESLIDLNSLSQSLPPVPEDARSLSTGWSSARSASLCSLKNFRRVKLMLQRADHQTDDEDQDGPGDTDGHSSQSEDGQMDAECSACNPPPVPIANKGSSLSNIQEENSQD